MSNPQSSFAVKFTLAEPDTLQAVRMWFNHTLNDENVAPFTLMVWDDNNGLPGDVLYEMPAQLPAFTENYLDFVPYYLEEPLAVSGTFYVGFFQNHDVQLNIGFDQNNDASGKFFYRTGAQWHPSFYKGAPMVRPVVGKKFDHSAVPHHNHADVKMYPNPTTGTIHVLMDDYGQDVDYSIWNVYGQCVESGKLHSAELSLEKYPKGVYFVQLSTQKQTIITEKIVKQ